MDDTRTTSKGTPWAATWDEGWAVCVEAVEGELGRRVCGARTLAGTPCSLLSEHRTGRCVFHGGTDAIGAPVGNSNARVHGLYARRLQRCGTHCPMWDHCPFASEEVLALALLDRPVCAYEAEEYDRVLGEFGRDALPRVHNQPTGHAGACPSPNDERDDTDSSVVTSTQHNLALLQVMVSRAAAALSVASFTDTVTSESDRYRMASTKVHAALEAFVRLTREHRAALKDFRGEVERNRAESGRINADSGVVDQESPWGRDEHGRPISLADFAAPLIERTEGVLEEAIDAENERKAYTHRLEETLEKYAGQGWRNEVEAEAEPP